MSVAELKEQIIKKIVTTDDSVFLNEVADFINEKTIMDIPTEKSEDLDEMDSFYSRLNGQFGDVLQKLAQ